MYRLLITILLISLIACDKKPSKLTFKSYPKLKIGLTTQSFTACMDVTFENTMHLIDYAHEKGFVWLEIRDPKAVLTKAECQDLDAYANKLGMELTYAIQIGLLDSGYWEVFHKGLENAQVFTGPHFYRAPACGSEFVVDTGKISWAVEELQNLIANANESGRLAKEAGLQLALENGYESLYGDSTTYGLGQLLDSTKASVGWQYDIGNFFGVSRANLQPTEVQDFVEKYDNWMIYVHLKSAQSGENMLYIGDHEIPWDTVFHHLSEKDIHYLAVELHCAEGEEAMYANIDKSLQYLKDNGFLTSQDQ